MSGTAGEESDRQPATPSPFNQKTLFIKGYNKTTVHSNQLGLQGIALPIAEGCVVKPRKRDACIGPDGKRIGKLNDLSLSPAEVCASNGCCYDNTIKGTKFCFCPGNRINICYISLL